MLLRIDTSAIRDNLPEHAPVGPSGMKRIMKCLPSLLPDGAIYEESSEAAQLGTMAHEGGELGLLKALRAEETLDVNVVGQDTIDAVNIYIDYVTPIMDRCSDFRIEGKFVYSEKLFGTGDFTGIERNIFWVIDYKNGVGEVDAEHNEQGLSYGGLALVDACQYTDEQLADIDTIKIVIVQPRAQGEDIKEWECSIEEVKLHLSEIIAISEMSEDTIRTHEYSHGDHCFFCPRKINCPYLDELTTGFMSGDLNTISGKELGEKLSACNVIESRIKTLKEYAYKQANGGTKVSGWKLVNKRATRKWINEKQIASLLDLSGYGDDKTFTKKFKSPAQIEKLVGKKEFEDFAPYAESISSGTTLVKDTDRRMEIIPKESFNKALDKLKAFNLKN